MKQFLSIAAILFCVPLLTQNNDPMGAQSGGLGHASVALSNGWSVFNNQAGLANIEKPFAGISYENRFLLKELSRNFVGVALPTESGTVSLSALSFGYSLYNEAKYGLGYARKLTEKMSMGVQLNYMTIRQGNVDFGNARNLTVELGFQAELTDDLRIGVHVFNPTQTELIDNGIEKIPTVFRLGGQYIISEKVFVVLESEKELDRPALFKTGLQYHVLDNLYLRGGLSTNPTYTSIGFGYVLDHLIIDFATSYQPILGYTPQFSLSYQFDNKGE